MAEDISPIARELAEMAALSHRIDALVELSPGEFEIQLSSNRSILAEYEPALGRLCFTAELGSPPEERRGEVAEALLAYSGLWRESGMVRAALDPVNGSYLLIVDLIAGALAPADLLAAFLSFVGKAETLSAFVASGAAAQPAATADNFVFRA